MTQASHEDALLIRDTVAWLERAVIGLNLCPFAKAVHVKGQIHYAISHATDATALEQDLVSELRDLMSAEPDERDTTLLIAPYCLHDFLHYNDFLMLADDALANLRLKDDIQIASFHPHYQFAGTDSEDVTNNTNRSPYPMLHLLREASVARAVAAVPEAADIYERNMETMQALGNTGWAALGLDASLPRSAASTKVSQ
jgi:hypothetical protein